MKKLLLFTVTAAAGVAAYFLVKNWACSDNDDSGMSHAKKQRHLTNAFSKAKQYSMSSSSSTTGDS